MSSHKRKFPRSSNPPPLFPASKKRKRQCAVEEVTYDAAAREEYLTGFHKRKQARIKSAKEKADQKERDERLVARKAMRDERKSGLSAWLDGISPAMGQAGDSDSEGDLHRQDKLDFMDWEEGQHARVTVEDMEVSADGIRRALEHDGSEHGEQKVEQKQGAEGKEGEGRAIAVKKDDGGKARKKAKKKDKRKKFRYESKGERKAERSKQREVKKKKAKKREAGF